MRKCDQTKLSKLRSIKQIRQAARRTALLTIKKRVTEASRGVITGKRAKHYARVLLDRGVEYQG